MTLYICMNISSFEGEEISFDATNSEYKDEVIYIYTLVYAVWALPESNKNI